MPGTLPCRFRAKALGEAWYREPERTAMHAFPLHLGLAMQGLGFIGARFLLLGEYVTHAGVAGRALVFT